MRSGYSLMAGILSFLGSLSLTCSQSRWLQMLMTGTSFVSDMAGKIPFLTNY